MLNRFYNGPKIIGRFSLLMLTIAASMGFTKEADNFKFSEFACKKPDVTVEAKSDPNDKKKGTLVIDFKNENVSALVVSVVGPKKFYIKNLEESELKGLSKGNYTVVIVGKDDSQNYCPTHIQLEI